MLEKPRIINLALIDDEKDFLVITESFLKKKNDRYFTRTFSSPIEFLEFLKDSENSKMFDVIISDYEMPDMTGLELLHQLKGNKKFDSKIPFILVTGKGRSEIIRDALNLGVDYYLEKSLDIEALYSELDHFILRANEQRIIEKELDELQFIYKTLVNLSPEGIIIHVETIIKFVNPAVVKFLGYPNASDLINKPVFDILDPSHHKTVRERWKNIFENEELPFDQFKLIRFDKSNVNCEATGRAITYNGQKAIIVYMRKMEGNLIS